MTIKQFKIYYHHHGETNSTQHIILDARDRGDALEKFNEIRIGFHRRHIDKIIEVS